MVKPLYPVEKFTCGHLKSPCDLDDVAKRDISLASFDSAYVRTVQTTQFGKFLLRQISTYSQVTNSEAES